MEKVFENLEKTITTFSESKISEERKTILQPLIDYIQAKVKKNESVRLNFICTHNSRRSHLSQIWAQTMAYFFNVPNVFSYSGGTETTALFPVIASTLTKQGFTIQQISHHDNPIYAVKYQKNEQPIIGFSKTFDDSFNPKTDFAAILTCSQADEGCPFIAGAEVRIPIRYEDPKAFDDTSFQEEKYAERSLEIGNEMYYVFSKVRV